MKEMNQKETIIVNGEVITKTTIGSLKKNEFLKLKADAKKVYQFDGYCRQNKKYAGTDYDDFCRQVYRKKDCVVYIGFEF